MNKTNQYATWGQWIFAILTVSILAAIYAAQTELTVLLFACAAISIILSLGLLALLLQANKALRENEQEVIRLQQREADHLQKKQQTVSETGQQTEAFKVDEALERIMPAAGTHFNNAAAFAEKLLQNIAKELDIVQGLVFVLNDADQLYHISGEYAYYSEEQPRSFPLGETLSGQVAKNRQLLNVKKMPDGYITVLSGLGKSNPHHLVIAPIVYNDESIGVMELASFKPFGENEEMLIGQICESTANLLNELRSLS
ncbi:MAG: GAF domain-containing protein [Bacteroidales bacterium]|jgi:transcriptional regulator with GAF, ATPase, and Fis domain|nr:GAF domain-containing protein [Bacteroidales bacterium]